MVWCLLQTEYNPYMSRNSAVAPKGKTHVSRYAFIYTVVCLFPACYQSKFGCTVKLACKKGKRTRSASSRHVAVQSFGGGRAVPVKI